MKNFGSAHRVNYDSSKFYERKMYAGNSAQGAAETEHHRLSKQANVAVSPNNKVPEQYLNTIQVHSSEHMQELPDSSVHLMVTSPPYNVGKEYDADLTFSEYRSLLKRVWEETYRVLVDGGRACINVANLGRKPYIPLNSLITADMLDVGFKMRGEVIWNKSASAGVSCAWGSWKSATNPVLRDVHEYIMVYSKGNFTRKRGKSKESTIQKNEFLEWTKSIWTFPSESAKRVGHPAPFPVELPSRAIKLLSFKGDVVLDPFIGSGTTAVAAEKLGRKWIGYDTSKHYVDIAYRRLNAECQPRLFDE